MQSPGANRRGDNCASSVPYLATAFCISSRLEAAGELSWLRARLRLTYAPRPSLVGSDRVPWRHDIIKTIGVVSLFLAGVHVPCSKTVHAWKPTRNHLPVPGGCLLNAHNMGRHTCSATCTPTCVHCIPCTFARVHRRAHHRPFPPPPPPPCTDISHVLCTVLCPTFEASFPPTRAPPASSPARRVCSATRKLSAQCKQAYCVWRAAKVTRCPEAEASEGTLTDDVSATA